jgi:cytochrome P450
MSTHAVGSDLAAATGIYLTDVRAKREPYDLLARLREEDPVHLSAAGTWIISGYDLALSVLRDTRFTRSGRAAGHVRPDRHETARPAHDRGRGGTAMAYERPRDRPSPVAGRMVTSRVMRARQ